jgi:hypothetical protein
MSSYALLHHLYPTTSPGSRKHQAIPAITVTLDAREGKDPGHQDSSPTSMVEAFEKVSKGAAIIAYKLALAQREIAELKAANEAATRQKSSKRKRVQAEGTLTVEDGARLAAIKDFGARSDRKKSKKRVDAEVGEPSQRRCTACKKTGHNARTYKYVAKVDVE